VEITRWKKKVDKVKKLRKKRRSRRHLEVMILMRRTKRP